ncbi:MAG: translation initiation factor IF-3 [Puniceicoccales bacterium]|jgi:translation initiation factor IF-3|nr:translation initiation factor IF-3 [Puniceicoccales bacterium]
MTFPQQSGPNRPPYPSSNNNNNRHGQYNRSNHQQGPRRNDRIRATDVRVIGPDGQQIGLMATRDALLRARDLGLDLVEISPNAHPPVCRIVDYGKFQYEESKRQKKQKAGMSRMKEIKLRPRCDVHDLMIKVKRAENFLYHGHKIKLIMSYRTREMEHPEVGQELLNRALTELKHIGAADYVPRLMGRSISTTITPVPQNKRKLIHNTTAEPILDDDSDEDDSDDEGDDDNEGASGQ